MISEESIVVLIRVEITLDAGGADGDSPDQSVMIIVMMMMLMMMR